MRSIALIPVAATIVALFACRPGPTPVPAPARSHLEEARHLLFDTPPPTGEATAGLASLLDAVLEAAPAARIPGDWTAKVSRARKLVQGTPPAFCEVASLLEESHRQVTGGPAWRLPASVVRISDVLALGRRQLDDAAAALESGRNADAVRLLLEAALLVVTPMPAPAGQP